MSKKDNKHYRPRHTRGEEDTVRAPKTPKRSFNEKQFQTGSETAEDLYPERIPEIPRKKSIFAQRVNISSLEEEPKPVVDTPVESAKITESPEITEVPEITESAKITEHPEVAEDPELTEVAAAAADVENVESTQKGDSPDSAVLTDADEETVGEAPEAVSDAAHHPDDGEETGAEEVALKVSVLSAAEALPEESAEQNDETDGNSQESEEKPRKKKKWKG